MRILFDVGVPRQLRARLPGLEIYRAQDLGWAELENGELLTAADREFDALVTTDKNLRHQQNLGRLVRLGIVLIAVRRVTPATVFPLTPEFDAALRRLQPGELIEVGEER